MISSVKSLLVAMVCVGLMACTSLKQKPTSHSQNILNLSNKINYQFSGKMSFSDGNEGGTGKVNWVTSAEGTKVELKAPLSNKSWRLEEKESLVTLTTSEGAVYSSQSAEDLLTQQIGWRVPWQPLQFWIIGLPSKKGVIKWDESKDVYTISDAGWIIEYSKLTGYENGLLPRKIIARNPPYSIKLSIKDWQL